MLMTIHHTLGMEYTEAQKTELLSQGCYCHHKMKYAPLNFKCLQTKYSIGKKSLYGQTHLETIVWSQKVCVCVCLWVCLWIYWSNTLTFFVSLRHKAGLAHTLYRLFLFLFSFHQITYISFSFTSFISNTHLYIIYIFEYTHAHSLTQETCITRE